MDYATHAHTTHSSKGQKYLVEYGTKEKMENEKTRDIVISS